MPPSDIYEMSASAADMRRAPMPPSAPSITPSAERRAAETQRRCATTSATPMSADERVAAADDAPPKSCRAERRR